MHKAYDYLDRSRFLGILKGYGVGPRALHLLQSYWERLEMMAQAGGYYRSPLCGERGATQGNPLSPTIFNVVVDAVVCHWGFLVVERSREVAAGTTETGNRRQGGRSRTKTTSDNG